MAAILVGALVHVGRSGSHEPQIPAATTTAPRASETAALQIATQFVHAHEYVGPRDGALAGGRRCHDRRRSGRHCRRLPPDVEFDRLIGWRFSQPQCTVTVLGPPTEVTRAYTMEDALSRALGVGPFTGSRFEYVIEGDRIQQVTHTFDYSQYSGQAFEVFLRWLDETHPGDHAVIFGTAETAVRSASPETLALLEQRIPEFVSAMN